MVRSLSIHRLEFSRYPTRRWAISGTRLESSDSVTALATSTGLERGKQTYRGDLLADIERLPSQVLYGQRLAWNWNRSQLMST